MKNQELFVALSALDLVNLSEKELYSLIEKEYEKKFEESIEIYEMDLYPVDTLITLVTYRVDIYSGKLNGVQFEANKENLYNIIV